MEIAIKSPSDKWIGKWDKKFTKNLGGPWEKSSHSMGCEFRVNLRLSL